MTNKPRGVLYIGATADLAARVSQVLAEPHGDIVLTIGREKALKAWKREWKIRLIEESNPEWRDISHLIP